MYLLREEEEEEAEEKKRKVDQISKQALISES